MQKAFSSAIVAPQKFMRPLLTGLACAALLAPFSIPAAQAFESGMCKDLVDNNNMAEVAADKQTQIKLTKCVLKGIDPPIKARTDGGTKPARGVPAATMDATICPPFAPCLVTSRLNVTGGLYADGDGGVGAAVPPTRYSAPQFSSHLPDVWPEELEGGGTVYFSGTVSVTPPDGGLIYSGNTPNYYSDGATVSITESHVAVPKLPGGNVMAGDHIVMNQDARINFDDGGVVVLPNGFNGTMGGKAVKGGDKVIINHAGDMRMPKGTKLYPFPTGSHPNGVHKNEANYTPYSGPAIQKPGDAVLTVNDTIPNCAPECVEPVPGLDWF